MDAIEWTIPLATAFVMFGGFAIQQALTILDPAITWLLGLLKDPSEVHKKSVMGAASLAIAAIVVSFGKFDALAFLYKDHTVATTMGMFITAIVLSAGTEGANTFQKYFGAVKDAKAAGPGPEVALFPTSVEVGKDGTVNFLAVVKNAVNTDVAWSLVEGAAGTVVNGVFTAAKGFTGTCHVVAKSAADTTAFAAASVKVG